MNKADAERVLLQLFPVHMRSSATTVRVRSHSTGHSTSSGGMDCSMNTSLGSDLTEKVQHEDKDSDEKTLEQQRFPHGDGKRHGNGEAELPCIRDIVKQSTSPMDASESDSTNGSASTVAPLLSTLQHPDEEIPITAIHQPPVPQYRFEKLIDSTPTTVVAIVRELLPDGSYRQVRENLFALKAVVTTPESQHIVQAEVAALRNCAGSQFVQDFKCAFHEDATFQQGDSNPVGAAPKPIPTQNHAILTELMECGDLRGEVKERRRTNNPFTPHEIDVLFAQIFVGLHHIHRRGYMHRDIKTANIFLKAGGLLKIGDFGFAMPQKYDPATLSFVGTPFYAAPEVWRQKHYDEKIDMFALGVVLYELITLGRPFEGNSIDSIRNRALKGVYAPPSLHSELVAALLHRDPNLRPSCCELAVRQDVQRALTSLCGSLIIAEQSPTAPCDPAARREVEALIIPTVVVQSPLTASRIPPVARDEGTEVVIREGAILKVSPDGGLKSRYLRLTPREFILARNREGADNSSRFVRQCVSMHTVGIQKVSELATQCAMVPPSPRSHAQFSGSRHHQGLFPFVVETFDFEPLTLATGSEQTRAEWVNALRSVIPVVPRSHQH